MVTYRCGSGRERALKEPSASDVCADVRTFACGLTIRFVCRQKLDRSATAHWRGQVAISTAMRRRVARSCSTCEESGGCVRAITIVVSACASAQYAAVCRLKHRYRLEYWEASWLRSLHVIASEAKQSILSYAAAWIAFARRAGQIFGDLPVVSIGRRPLHEVVLARKVNQFAARRVGKAKRAHHLSSNMSWHASLCLPCDCSICLTCACARER